MDINPTAKATAEEAAPQINQLMGDEGYSIEEKIAIRREIDDNILKWQTLRSSI